MAQVLRHLPQTGPFDPNVIVGVSTRDDAGVYRINETTALVQTVDFFTPIVDDAVDYGRIAAANSLSDVYAMGAEPLTALNIVGFPIGQLPHQLLADILRGGMEAVAEAGATLVGGHSIDQDQPVFGLAVTGIVHPDKIWRNHGARIGDVLILTKPIGIGAITTGIKRGVVAEETAAAAVATMRRLNRDARDAGLTVTVHAATDITGFGLLGHALEMAEGAEAGLRINAARVPVLPGARDLIAQGVFPGGTKKNLQAAEPCVEFAASLDAADRLLLADAVTSGGLLFAVPAHQAERLQEALAERGALSTALIGEVAAGIPKGSIHVYDER